MLSDRLLALLAPYPHQVLDHAPAVTAEEAAAARGTPLAIGGKSVLMKLDKLGWTVVVVGSGRRIEGALLRRALGIQRYRFASPEELGEVTGLVPGALPPFGRPLLDVGLVAGADLLERAEIAFAAADRARSVRMATADWVRAAEPRVVSPFTLPSEPT